MWILLPFFRRCYSKCFLLRTYFLLIMKLILAAFIALLFSVCLNELQAQSNRLDLNKIVPQTPNVMALGKYGDQPVNMANGIPKVEIPLYTVKTAELELPLSLSYHAGGIKVDEESSFIGLGWVLNSGGVITRVIKDRDDWGSSYGFSTRYNSIPSFTNIDDPNGPEPGGIGNSAQLRSEFESDKEPDLFIINAPGLTANFCRDNQGNFVTLDYEPLKINVDYLGNIITVIDKYGRVLRFGKSFSGAEAFETTNVVNSHGASPPMGRTAWYLTEIISTDKSDTIKFEYKSLPYFSNLTNYITRYHIYDDNLPVMDMRNNEHQGVNYSSRSTSVTNTRIIDKIVFKHGHIQFTHVSDRQDVNNSSGLPLQAARISGFSVYDWKNMKIKSVVFNNNDHFNRTGIGNSIIPNGSIPNIAKKSLKLNGVEFFGIGDIFDSKYQFEYDATPLPPRNTTSQDVWGYYNGKSVTDFIPLTFYTFRPFDPTTPYFVGSNRDPDFSFMKAGSLKKIIYPTGGYSTFEFEPNYYLSDEQQEEKTPDTRSFSVNAINRLTSCAPEYMAGAGPSTVYEFTVNEDLGSTGQALVTFSLHFSDYQQYSGTPMRGKISELSGQFSYTFDHLPADRLNPKTVQQTFIASEGQSFRIELYTNGNTGSTVSMCNSPFIEASLFYNYWKFADNSLIQPQIAGGLRVKKIQQFSSSNSIVNEKKYEYGNQKYGSNQVGVGHLITDPHTNFYYSFALYAIYNCEEVLKRNINFTAESQVGLGMNYGSPVDYSKVTEYNSDAASSATNGKTEYYYSKTDAIYEPMGSNRYPHIYRYFPSWGSSNLVKKVDYKSVGTNNYECVQSLDIEYVSGFEKKIKTLKVIEYQPDIYTVSWGGAYGGCNQPLYFSENSSRFFYYNFYVSVNRQTKHAETITQFLNGIATMSNRTVYSYNNNYDLKSEISTNSKGASTENKYKYVSDLNYTTLISNNVLSLPVNRESFVNNKLINGEIIKYNDWGKQTEIFKVNTAVPITATNYSDKDVLPSYYTRYNTILYNSTTKRVVEIENENSIKTAYLWAYNSQFPIAEITNATYSSVETALTATSIQNMWNNYPNISEVNSFISSLKSNPSFSKSLFKSYSFDPLTGVNAQSNVNSMNTFFTYDFIGRLILVRDHFGKILKQYCYNYAGQTVNCTFFINTDLSNNFTRNNCGAGFTGGSVYVNIPSGMFTSTISQADANNQATSYGQAKANLLGTCISSSVSISCNNTVNDGSGLFQVVLTNENTNQVYNFTSSPSSNVTLGTIPAGMYTIYISRSTGGNGYVYQVGCGYYGGGTNYTFENVSINSSCNSIQIQAQ